MYSTAPFLATPISSDLYLVQDPLTFRFDIVTRELFSFLQIRSAIPLVRGYHPTRKSEEGLDLPDSVVSLGAPVLTTLHDLIACGWLVSHERLLHDLRARREDEPAVNIGTVAIVTKNRLQCLMRCVESILKNRQRYGRTYRLLVSDDGDPANRAIVVSALRALAEKFDAPLYYAGHEERTRFTCALASASGINPALLTFAFRSDSGGGLSTHGANMNCVMAATIGETLLRCDDDIVWDGGPAPGATNDLVLGSVPDPTVIRYFASPEAVKRAVEWTDVDIAAIHEKALGRGLGNIVCDHRIGNVRCESITLRLWQALSRNSARARVSSLGLAGDCGLRSARDWLFAAGESQRHLFADGYEHARTTRQVILAATAMCLTEGRFFMNTACGFDNRSLCPPYLPVCRNSDGLFANVMHVCAQDAYFVHFPWVVLHDPPPRAFRPGDSRADATRVRASDLLISWINSAPIALGVGTDLNRLKSLGQYLKSLTELGSEFFNEHVRRSVLALHHLRIGRLAERWTDVADKAPDPWKQELHGQLEELGRALRSGGGEAPADLSHLKARPGMEDTCFRQIVSQFGDLLYEWPDIMHCAVELKEKGEEVASPITEMR
jgi:hypothetical protein